MANTLRIIAVCQLMIDKLTGMRDAGCGDARVCCHVGFDRRTGRGVVVASQD